MGPRDFSKIFGYTCLILASGEQRAKGKGERIQRTVGREIKGKEGTEENRIRSLRTQQDGTDKDIRKK